jgi:predicted outer membrane repeat protein
MIKAVDHLARRVYLRAGLALVIILSLVSTRPIRAAGPTCSVPGTYGTITAAVSDAGCLTIHVGAGTYNEFDIIVSHNVSIVGNSQSPASVILDAGSTTHRGFYINAGYVVTLSGLTIQHGNAGGSGGGIENHGTLLLEHSQVISNAIQGGNGGAGLYNAGNATLNDVVLSANIAPTITAFYGGGIDNDISGVMTVTSASIYGNSAAFGGGINNSGILNLSHSTISTNTLAVDGAGLANGGQLTVTLSSVFGNVASFAGGGFVNWGAPSQVIISATTFANNSAPNGGGLYNGGTGSAVTVSNSLFTYNRASDRGGAIYNGEILRVMTDTFAYNSALNGDGGGVANLGVVDSEIDSSAFYGNAANADGGAIYSASTQALTLTNDSLSANVAATGGGVSHDGGTLTILNSTLNANNAATGGNLAASSGTLSLKNTIIASGSPTNCWGNIANGGHNLQYGDLSCGGAVPNQNPELGPLQVNAPGSTATKALLAGSPAIDAGDNSGCPATDQRGVPRPINSICDIGAYEYGLFLKVYLPLLLKHS